MSTLNDRTMNMIARGVLQATDDSKGVQVLSLSLLAGERKDNVERFQNYGFTSMPTGEAEAIVIFPGGDRSAGVVVALDNRAARMTGLQLGEVAVYTEEGDSIVLGLNRQIEITTRRLVVTATETVQITAPHADGVRIIAPQLRVEGDVNVTGTVTDGVP
jgi:phage baseplate assembly protein V